MLLKAVAGVSALSIVSVGGYFAVVHSIGWTSAASDNLGAGTIGKKYGQLFLSSETNSSWWNKKYKDHERSFSGLKDKFKTVNKGFDNKEATSLNKVCEAAYKETSGTNLLESDPNSGESVDKFVKRNIWKFCAPYEIKTISEKQETYETTALGGVDANKKIFVSAKDNVNDWFWSLKTKEFWEGKKEIKGDDPSKHHFKKLKDDESKKWTNIKTTCEEIYRGSTSENSDGKNKEDAELFCSIKLSTT